MAVVTKYVTTENRVATSDPRFDMRLSNDFDDDETPSSGWAWVGAILVAAVLIVSGYLDQDSTNAAGPAVSTAGERYASTTPSPPVIKLAVNDAGNHADQG